VTQPVRNRQVLALVDDAPTLATAHKDSKICHQNWQDNHNSTSGCPDIVLLRCTNLSRYTAKLYINMRPTLHSNIKLKVVLNSMNGKFQLWHEQNVILAVVIGGWDRRTAEEYSAEFKKLASKLLDAPWAHIVYLDQWELGVPEIEPIIQELVQWCIAHNLRFAAQVYCPHMVKRYQLERMIIERTEFFERRVYPTQIEAFQWLASEGFHMQTQDLQQKAS